MRKKTPLCLTQRGVVMKYGKATCGKATCGKASCGKATCGKAITSRASED